MNEPIITKRFPRTYREAFKPLVDTGMERYLDNTWKNVIKACTWVALILLVLFLLSEGLNK